MGKIITVEKKECEITFLRRSNKMRNKFYYPQNKDVSMVKKSDVAHLLPKPRLLGTKRQQNFLQFYVNFAQLDVR